MTSTDDDYVCGLDGPTLQKAIAELNEVPADRMAAVAALREWVLKQPHIRSRTDIQYLLTFLRGAKFSQLRAREMIEGSLQMLTKAPEWFGNIDTKDPRILKVIDRGYAIPLPKKDKDGCKILLYRVGALDHSTKEMRVADEIRTGIVGGNIMSSDENVHVNGCHFVFDFTGYTAKHMGRWKVEDMRKWFKMWQHNMPGRFKGFHYYNAGTFMDMLLTIVKPFLSKKFQERTHSHSTLESLYKYIPMEYLPLDYLPDDYKGPHQGTLQEIIDDFKRIVTDETIRQNILTYSSDKYGIDEDKRPTQDVPQESFRKINLE